MFSTSLECLKCILKQMASVSSLSQDILNHVLSDVELFMGILAAASSTKSKDGKGKNNNKIKRKHSKKKGIWPHRRVLFIISIIYIIIQILVGSEWTKLN